MSLDPSDIQHLKRLLDERDELLSLREAIRTRIGKGSADLTLRRSNGVYVTTPVTSSTIHEIKVAIERRLGGITAECRKQGVQL